MKRRNVLKTVGASTLATATVSGTVSAGSVSFVHGHTETSNYDSSDPTHLNVDVYEAQNASSTNREDAADAMERALKRLKNNTSLGGYQIDCWETGYSLGGGGACDELEKWACHLTNDHYHDWDGVHLLIHDRDTGTFAGNADSCGAGHNPCNENAGQKGGPFVNDTYAISSNKHYAESVADYKSVVLQEAGHAIISHRSCGNSWEATQRLCSQTSGNSGEGREHELGHREYYNGSYWETPMMTHHGPAKSYGDCNNDNNRDGFFLWYSNCAEYVIDGVVEDAKTV
jgi:hypothetical protein